MTAADREEASALVSTVINWTPISWRDIDCARHGTLEARLGRRIEQVGEKDEWFISLEGLVRDSEVEAFPPSVWREVLAKLWAFEDPPHGWDEIAKVYRLYGPVTRAGCSQPYESLSAARASLLWLSELVRVVAYLKEKRLEPLWERLGEVQESGYLFRGEIPGTNGREVLSIPAATPTLHADGELVPVLVRNDSDLTALYWEAAVWAASERFQSIPLTPVSENFRVVDRPRLVWGFQAEGVFEVAFLQWFFQEMQGFGPKKCAAPDCGRPVSGRRIKWCSDTCRERIKKRSK